MIGTEEIALGLRGRVEGIRLACGHESASHAFESLFFWKRDMSLSICLREEVYAVRCGLRGEGCWFFPCGRPDAAAGLVGDLLDSGGPPLHLIYVRGEDAALLEERFPGRFRIEAADGDSEYLYDRAAYTAMQGKEWSKVRWSIRHLHGHHEVRVEEWDDAHDADMSAVVSAWDGTSVGEDGLEDKETSGILMEHGKELGATGIIVYLDGRPAAMAAGFPLSPRSYDMAFAKAIDPARGLLYFTRHRLAETLPASYTIVNGEEDLGIDGLRRAKLLERPMGRIEMYQAYEN